MSSILTSQRNFRSLSITDLLKARDQYHYHLMNKANVVGTAIGLYLIRKSDPYPKPHANHDAARAKAKRPPKEPRTFAHSEVRDYSWPCVLVLVKNWVDLTDFGAGRGQVDPDELVPKTLYLPDGREVPVCVVKVEPAEAADNPVPDWHWPDALYGGGLPIIVEAQQREHRATAGCLVTDGHTVYALTSRHVCGAAGEPVYTLAGGRRKPIGRASARHLTRLHFKKIYPKFPLRQTYVNLDVGLIELDNVNEWTSQVFGLGATGPLADLNELNITTRLIDARVVASGAASGRLEGRIKALFYRYKSVGGYDYVADFLIAPDALEDGSDPQKKALAQTQPGDSGAIWHLVDLPPDRRDEIEENADRDVAEEPGNLRPLAVEWGGQVFMEGAARTQFAFALATSLTTVCRFLDVELVLNHNTGVQPYWGQTGHYSIASFACDALADGKLGKFMKDNLDQISFSIGELTPKQIAERLKAARAEDGFVPLADVPDVVWKNFPSKVPGGRDHQVSPQKRSTGPEHPTHYADIDEPRESDGKTLRELCISDPDTNVAVSVWQQFYTAAGHTEQHARGLLPFRVWQFFDAMVGFAENKKPDQFLCAAGILAHYVGDACQPLHGSIYADGYADQPTTVIHHKRDTGEEYEEQSHVGAGVHSTYESNMIDRHYKDIVRQMPDALTRLENQGGVVGPIRTGKDAAIETVRLMDRSAHAVPPKDLVDAFIQAGAKPTVAVQDALWEKFGDETVAVMADGAYVLAKIWEAAWAAGHGNSIAKSALVAVDGDGLRSNYIREDFVPSLDLDHIAAALT